MKKNIALLLIAAFSILNYFPVSGDEPEAGVVWQRIKSYFTPPAEFQNQLGDFRSPLKFYDGRPVKTPGDWKKRREEILSRWHAMMGDWPALIKDQQVEILESVQKDGYTKKKVRFNWNPNEKTEGYLLIPDGEGERPAVITVYYEPETAVDERNVTHDFALQLTKRGFVTLSIGTSQTTKSRTYAMYYPEIENASVQPLTMLACAASNAWYVLSKMPEVDSKRIGIMGHSYGGKWAMFST